MLHHCRQNILISVLLNFVFTALGTHCMSVHYRQMLYLYIFGVWRQLRSAEDHGNDMFGASFTSQCVFMTLDEKTASVDKR